MNAEMPLRFDCQGFALAGILHRPAQPGPVGVVVVVGGPQYRVGSHRQFVLLARHLAAGGFPVLRFDCRGMGDSGGEFPGFEAITDDIRAAVDTLFVQLPGLRAVVLWGLCDAASAALMYVPGDERIAGLVLANPWVRSQATLARTQLRTYYFARLMSGEFWGKLLSGALSPSRALRDLVATLRAGARRPVAEQQPDFVTRMREGLCAFRNPVLLILSGDDLTAAEFVQLSATGPWSGPLARPQVERHVLPAASHTFSTAAWRDEVAACTRAWLERVAARIDTGVAR